MSRAADLLALDRAERRRALLRAATAIGAVAAVDLALGFAWPRAAIWSAWLGAYLLATPFVRRGSQRLAYACTLGPTLVSVAGLLGLSITGGGSASPAFHVLIAVPLLMALTLPDDLAGAAVVGGSTVLGGAALLASEGRPWPTTAIWIAAALAVVALAVASTAQHRRRQERALAAELERARTVEQLAESERGRILAERWAAVGLLADGVAHDVNSPLGSLRSNLAFAREELAAGRAGDVDAALADAQEGVERIREIVASLRAFSLSEVEAQEKRALAERPTPTPAPLPSRLTPVPGGRAARRPR